MNTVYSKEIRTPKYKAPFIDRRGVKVTLSSQHKDLWIMEKDGKWWSITAQENEIMSRHKPKHK
jgi:hypothetical protein